MLQAIVDEKAFPASLRTAALTSLGLSYLSQDNLEGIERILALPDSPLAASQREHLTGWREVLQRNAAGPASLEPYIAEQFTHPLSKLEVKNFLYFWERLLLLGPPDIAARFGPRLDSLTAADGDHDLEDALRLAAKRLIPTAAARRRQLDAARAFVKTDGAPRRARPALIDDVANTAVLMAVQPSECLEILLWELDSLTLDLAGTATWAEGYTRCLESIPSDGARQRDFAFASLDAAVGDEDRSEILLATTDILSDDQVVWPSLIEGLRGRIDPGREPKTWQVFHLMEISRALRRGEKVDWEAEAARLTGDRRKILSYLQQPILLRERDPAAIGAYLRQLSPEDLKSGQGLLQRLRLAQLLPDSPEKPSIASAARRQIYVSRLKALTQASPYAARQVIQLSRELGDTSGYTRQWLDQVLAGIDNELRRLELRVIDATAREDWATVYSNTKKLIAAENPDHGDQWDLGLAAFHLGKTEEAKTALRLFLAAANSEAEAPEARELLAKLEGGKR